MSKHISQPNNCPRCEERPTVYAGDGMYDHIVKCDHCGFSVEGGNRNATVDQWNSTTGSIRSRMATMFTAISKYRELVERGHEPEEAHKMAVEALIIWEPRRRS